MPQFVANGPIVPDKLVQDLEDDRVVIFCGAGVSMGAGLPSYNGLVRDCYNALSHPLPTDDEEWKWPDRMLGVLESRFTGERVRQAVAARLNRRPRTLEMHRAILRLSRLRRNNGMRLITTNFDTYFERARRGIDFGHAFEIHAGPILPIPRDDITASWRSLVYLHGRLGGSSQQLVLTSADFGRAYLTEGWAARFIVRLFADYTVLFLGYSLNDPVLRYMTDAFAAENHELRLGQPRGPAYIFAGYSGSDPPDEQSFRDRNLEPIFYSNADNHARLRETVIQWADWRDDYLSSVGRLIGEIAPRRPDAIDPTASANLVWAVAGRSDDRGFGARTFAAVDPAPPIEWLPLLEAHDTERAAAHVRQSEAARERGRPLPSPLSLNFMPLFPWRTDGRADDLTPAGLALLPWFCRHLENEGLVNRVIDKIGQGRMLHARLRHAIRLRLVQDPPIRPGFSRFWWILVGDGRWFGVSRHQVESPLFNVQVNYPLGVDRGWVRQELLAGLSPVLDFSVSNFRAYRAVIEPEQAEAPLGDRLSEIADAEVELWDANHVRGMIDAVEHRPGADVFWCEMLDELTSLLARALELFAVVGKADAMSDPSRLQRPSVVPHPQNHHHKEWTRLFDLVWRGWEHLDAQDAQRSRAVVARWRMIPYLSFRRLVAAAVNHSAHFSAEEKAEVLLHG